MKKRVVVKNCYHSCPFFRTEMSTMYCGHPYFDDKDVNANMIITQENSRTTAPLECPLRIEPLEIEYVILWKMEEI